MSSSENLPPSVLLKLMREIQSLTASPLAGIRLLLNEANISALQAELNGPVGTPFEGGRFRVQLVLPSDYPASPPKGFFLTKLFHPNVSASGEICVNTLKKDWSPSHGLRHVLLVIHCLLIHPNPESALNEEAGRLLMEDYREYEKRCRLMTKIHATSKKSATSSAEPGDDSLALATVTTAATSPRHINANNCASSPADVAATASPCLVDEKRALAAKPKAAVAAKLVTKKSSMKRL